MQIYFIFPIFAISMGKAKKYRQHVASAPRPAEYIPQRLPVKEGKRLVSVLVEGYEDVSFWRGIFDRYEDDHVTFEVSVPPRNDLAKGKKTLLGLAGQSGRDMILCMDSDFDYLFADQTEQARIINSSPFMLHTYAYATENYLCYAPSLHNVCVKATKNDTRIFDFEKFFADYSQAIFPAFLWYAYSAQMSVESVFQLMDFKSTVRLGYLDIENNGAETIEWLKRQVARRVATLENKYPQMAETLPQFEQMLFSRNVTHSNVYLFMHGHTLMDNVVMVVLDAVCNKLMFLANRRIDCSARAGVALANEKSNYKNSTYNVRDALLFNENYKECFLYKKLESDIECFLATSV